MSAYQGKSATDHYLEQRLQGASPEQWTVLLLEGAERGTRKAVAAVQHHDIGARAQSVNRVSAILEELTLGLNLEQGGALALNLARIYDWWLHELFAASQENASERLEHLAQQMAELRKAWNTLPAVPASAPPSTPGSEGWMG